MKISPSSILFLLLGLLAGLGLGLVYSWRISPVTYVDAHPAILRDDFKDQYRVVIAAAYASSHDLPRARARLELLSDTDAIGELSAQAQRMTGAGESLRDTQLLAQLAADLQQGFASNSVTTIPVANTAFIIGTPFIPVGSSTPDLSSVLEKETTPTAIEFSESTVIPTVSFEQTPLAPQQLSTPTARPTSTPTPGINMPFTLIGQDTVCDMDLNPGLLQFILTDSRRNQVAGVQIIVTWAEGEDRFFTGFKPEVGDGYADFIMQADTVYSIRVVDGGSFVPNISAPTCADENGGNYLGGLLLTFQQP
jgi:hypothetical protein